MYVYKGSFIPYLFRGPGYRDFTHLPITFYSCQKNEKHVCNKDSMFVDNIVGYKVLECSLSINTRFKLNSPVLHNKIQEQ